MVILDNFDFYLSDPIFYLIAAGLAALFRDTNYSEIMMWIKRY